MLHFIAVKGKQSIRKRPETLVATRVFPETKRQFELAAESQNRNISQELRQMIERRVEEFETELAEAA